MTTRIVCKMSRKVLHIADVDGKTRCGKAVDHTWATENIERWKHCSRCGNDADFADAEILHDDYVAERKQALEEKYQRDTEARRKHVEAAHEFADSLSDALKHFGFEMLHKNQPGGVTGKIVGEFFGENVEMKFYI